MTDQSETPALPFGLSVGPETPRPMSGEPIRMVDAVNRPITACVFFMPASDGHAECWILDVSIPGVGSFQRNGPDKDGLVAFAMKWANDRRVQIDLDVAA